MTTTNGQESRACTDDVRIEKIKSFVAALGRSDFDAAVSEMTQDVVRIGCYNTPNDIVTGRDNYLAFIRQAGGAFPGYDNNVTDISHSHHRPRVYLEYTEHFVNKGAQGGLVECPLCIAFDFNDDCKITKLSLYWRSMVGGSFPLASQDWETGGSWEER